MCLPAAETISEPATIGHRVHAFAEYAHRCGRDRALADLDLDGIEQACEAIPVQYLDSASFASEVAFAYDVDTQKARELGRGIGRKYGDLRATEYAGTADLIALVDADTVYVGDFKRSLWSLPPAVQSVQLGFYALCAARTYGRGRAIVEFVPYGTDERPDRAEWDAFALDEFELGLGALHSRQIAAQRDYAGGVMPPATIGPHCRYCPSFSFCPANTMLAKQMATSEALVTLAASADLTTTTAASLWPKVKQAQAVLDQIRETLETFARQTPITLADGTMVQVRETRRESIDGDVAHEILAAMSPKLAAAVCSWDVTKARIKQAAKSLSLSEEDILSELRRKGAVKTTMAASVVEVRAKRGRAA
jgi:hypothetical protein